MKKRIFALILASLMLLGCFAACKDDNENNSSADSSDAVSTESGDSSGELSGEEESTGDASAEEDSSADKFNSLTDNREKLIYFSGSIADLEDYEDKLNGIFGNGTENNSVTSIYGDFAVTELTQNGEDVMGSFPMPGDLSFKLLTDGNVINASGEATMNGEKIDAAIQAGLEGLRIDSDFALKQPVFITEEMLNELISSMASGMGGAAFDMDSLSGLTEGLDPAMIETYVKGKLLQIIPESAVTSEKVTYATDNNEAGYEAECIVLTINKDTLKQMAEDARTALYSDIIFKQIMGTLYDKLLEADALGGSDDDYYYDEDYIYDESFDLDFSYNESFDFEFSYDDESYDYFYSEEVSGDVNEVPTKEEFYESFFESIDELAESVEGAEDFSVVLKRYFINGKGIALDFEMPMDESKLSLSAWSIETETEWDYGVKILDGETEMLNVKGKNIGNDVDFSAAVYNVDYSYNEETGDVDETVYKAIDLTLKTAGEDVDFNLTTDNGSTVTYKQVSADDSASFTMVIYEDTYDYVIGEDGSYELVEKTVKQLDMSFNKKGENADFSVITEDGNNITCKVNGNAFNLKFMNGETETLSIDGTVTAKENGFTVNGTLNYGEEKPINLVIDCTCETTETKMDCNCKVELSGESDEGNVVAKFEMGFGVDTASTETLVPPAAGEGDYTMDSMESVSGIYGLLTDSLMQMLMGGEGSFDDVSGDDYTEF